jgi:hypothetical protein
VGSLPRPQILCRSRIDSSRFSMDTEPSREEANQ